MKKYWLLAGALCCFLPVPGLAGPEAELWEKLKNGGMVVLMRHASVNKGKDRGNSLLRDPSCKKERNLSERGREEAVKTGKVFAEKGIPVERVMTSPYCRTVDTARLAFDQSNSVEFLSLIETLPQDQAEANTERLTKEIGSYSGKGNLILVTHEPNIAAISFETVEHGAFIVLEPMGEDEFEEIGKIRLNK